MLLEFMTGLYMYPSFVFQLQVWKIARWRLRIGARLPQLETAMVCRRVASGAPDDLAVARAIRGGLGGPVGSSSQPDL